MIMMRDPVLRRQMEQHIIATLREDMPFGDLSTAAVMPEFRHGEVQLICKQDGVIAGLEVFERTFKVLEPHETSVEGFVQDGDEVEKGQLLAIVHSDVRVLLSGERTALNYLQRMSGIATYTRKFVKQLEGTNTRIVCTRKTTPGMRLFEREAVRIGGGGLHRAGLSDAVMLKDNHIDAAGSIAAAVAAAKVSAPFTAKIEVECETLDMVQQALDAGADIIMLDNMNNEQRAAAVKLIDRRAMTEVSGNITLENVAEVAGLGVDIVSSGALTHSAGILDLSLKHLRVLD